MDLLDHAMAIGGWGLAQIKRLPSPGVTITKIDWRGCMATDRHVDDTGDILRYESQDVHGARDPVKGIVIQYDKAGEQWEPLDRLRIVNGEAEIWS